MKVLDPIKIEPIMVLSRKEYDRLVPKLDVLGYVWYASKGKASDPDINPFNAMPNSPFTMSNNIDKLVFYFNDDKTIMWDTINSKLI